MNRLRLPITFACATLLASGLAAGGEIYKWIDENGNVHYEDRPIGEGNVERVVEVEMDEEERKLFDASVEHVRSLVDQIQL